MLACMSSGQTQRKDASLNEPTEATDATNASASTASCPDTAQPNAQG